MRKPAGLSVCRHDQMKVRDPALPGPAGMLRRRIRRRGRSVMLVIEALVRMRDVRKAREECPVVRVNSVCQRVIRTTIESRYQNSGRHAKRDVDHVITEPAPVREPASIATERAEAIR